MALTLFNQPNPARVVTPWQPNAGIAKKLSSRGYTPNSWHGDEQQEYAALSYPAKPSGFSAAHYQPSKQPLSEQARASLALLEEEYRNESLGQQKPAPVIGSETNEHLPFVMDAYGASRKSKLRVSVAPSVLERALAQAEMAESLVVSPITTDEKVADPIVIHPDVPDAPDVLEAQAHVLTETDAHDAPAEQSAEATLPESTPNEFEPLEPEVPAVVGGIPPEEVAQREAEQFAKGLTQAREEAAAALEKAVQEATEAALAKGREEGLEKGKAEGLAEGLEQGLAQGMEQGKAQGFEQGKAEGFEAGKDQGLVEGEAKVRAELADEMAEQRVVFENVAAELGTLIADPKKFFEPLKRLAMHVAEQVVLSELQTSSKGIERLVQRCLDELDHPVHGAVVLELNPDDKALLQVQGGDFIKGMRLESVQEMQRGSVRVFANDTVVEDLIDHRLEGLAKALLIDVDAWREKSPLVQRISEVQEEVEGDDVHS